MNCVAPPIIQPPAGGQELLRRIDSEFGRLSRQLQLVARYVQQQIDSIAEQRIEDVAHRCGATPSAVVRFAQRFGYTGFQDLKRALRREVRRYAPPLYDEREARAMRGLDGRAPTCTDVAYAFLDGVGGELDLLRRDVQITALREAVGVMADAQALWVVGARRSYAVASYLACAMQGLPKPVHLVNFAGAMHEGHLHGMRPGDVLVAVGLGPCEESLRVVDSTHALGLPVIAITDSSHNPMAFGARAVLVVHEPSSFGLPSPINGITVAHSLFLALAFELEVLTVDELPALKPLGILS